MRKTPMLLLMVVAGITMMALGCPPTARPPVTPPAEPPPPEPTPEPPPPPPETEMRWTIGPDDFGDDDATIWAQTSNRSGPYEWDRISAGNVRVSIGGKELTATGENPPAFTSTWHEPAFDSDLTGAEWTVTAEVRAGAVVLVLTAPDQTYYDGPVVRVRMTSGGSGYASPPTVTFGTSPPVTFGSGGGGSGAAGVAVLQRRGNDEFQNLYFARRTLYGKELLVQFTGE